MSATEEALGALHTALAEQLTKLVQEGASASHLAVAAKFLKDNNITCTPATDNALGALEAEMAKRRAGAKLNAQEKAELGKLADVTHLMH